MPLTRIVGTYRIVGTSPDGDSVRFHPDDPNAFQAAHIAAKTNAGGGAQLFGIVVEQLPRRRRAPVKACLQLRVHASRDRDRQLLSDDRADERAVMVGRGTAAIARMTEHARTDAADDRGHHGVGVAQVRDRLPVIGLSGHGRDH